MPYSFFFYSFLWVNIHLLIPQLVNKMLFLHWKHANITKKLSPFKMNFDLHIYVNPISDATLLDSLFPWKSESCYSLIWRMWKSLFIHVFGSICLNKLQHWFICTSQISWRNYHCWLPSDGMAFTMFVPACLRRLISSTQRWTQQREKREGFIWEKVLPFLRAFRYWEIWK